MNPPNKVIVDLAALAHNFRQIKLRVGRHTRIMGVVKADAYGHGLLPVSRTLVENRVDCLGVAFIHEALELRQHGIKIPIVILCGLQTGQEVTEAVEHALTPVIYDLKIAEAISREGERRGKPVPVHLKVDTGMGRLGIAHTEIGPFVQRLSGMKGILVEALTSHLSCADQSETGFTEGQVACFQEAVSTVRALGHSLPLNSLANSAGLMGREDAFFEMVRPGICLYGGRPGPDFPLPVALKPVMHFAGQVLQVRDLPDRTPVSYGRTYYTHGPRRIAIVSAGYSDGLFRSMSNAGHALIRGQKAPIVGTVSMNLTALDVTGIKDAAAGDQVVLLGTQGDLVITGDDVAGCAGTISYEVFCSLGRQSVREYRS